MSRTIQSNMICVYFLIVFKPMCQAADSLTFLSCLLLDSCLVFNPCLFLSIVLIPPPFNKQLVLSQIYQSDTHSWKKENLFALLLRSSWFTMINSLMGGLPDLGAFFLTK